MRLTKYFHSCFLLEQENDRILFDPGIFCFLEGRVKPEVFKDIKAIFITHSHPDHLDTEVLKKIVANNPGVSIFCNSHTKDVLDKAGIPCAIFEKGEEKMGSFRVQALAAQHETVLVDNIQNTAFLVNDLFLHPGDSLDYRLRDIKGLEVLALPILAPWGKVTEVAEFAQAIKPKHIVPCHDGHVLDLFLQRHYGIWQKHYEGGWIDFRPLKTGEVFEF